MKRHPTTLRTSTAQIKVKRVRKCVRNSRSGVELSSRRVEIAPRSKSCQGRLAALTGLSVGYCALVRRGIRTPHPRCWEVLAEIGARQTE